MLKLFPLAQRRTDARASASAQPIDATGVIAKIARRQRSVFAVYAGFNESVRVTGIAPPRRWQPSPLNLIVRGLDSRINHDEIVLDTFEFLDMDAY